ncbi:MAG: MCE family protein [Candidatus Omnitrophica bacterium]|nr:MCE family protein [Candidatus Omnitrophota bacterium]
MSKEINYADLQNREQRKYFTAGLFFAVGLILLISFIFTIGSNKGFTQRKFHVSILFREVGGLNEGAPVRLLGVTVGSVSNIEFLDKDVMGRRVRVDLAIFNKYRKQLSQSVSFSIETEGILGEKLVEISSLDGAPIPDLSKMIIGKDPFEVQDLATVFADAAASFTETAKGLSEIDTKGLADVMMESSRALLITSNGLNETMGDLKEAAKKTNRLLDRVEQKIIDGSLFKVF